MCRCLLKKASKNKDKISNKITKEGERIRMNKILKNKKRNNINSFGCNNSNTLDTGRSKHKLNN